MHDCNEGEEVAIFLTLEKLGYFDEAAKEFGSLKSISSSHDREGNGLGKIQVSVEKEKKKMSIFSYE